MLAWYFTDYRGIAAIGIFMFEGPPGLRLRVQLAYPDVFLILAVTTVIAHRISKVSCAGGSISVGPSTHDLAMG